MKIVGIGGGTGLPVLLSGLREIQQSHAESLEITAVVTVSDSGGSTGALREAFAMPAMGDIRKCMVALAPEHSVLTSVCKHRFDNPQSFAGHSLGNLILSALYQMNGDFAAAVRQAGELLELQGRVLPATYVPVTLCALHEDDGIVRGESNIPRPGRRIRRVWFDVQNPPAAPGVLEALRDADAIVLGPGSLYTSVVPNLLVAGIVYAILESKAIKIYVTNLMTQAGETEGYSAADHLSALLEYLPAVDVCVLNSSAIGTGVAERYLRSGAEIVSGSPEDEDRIRRRGTLPVAVPLLKVGETKARHDSEALARLVVSLARGFTAAHEVLTVNGR
ncbi:MAG TPA: gluconeogenesis factor YvcK family protein [Terriglobia bacterium]|nr:gluconeogenesis factor YvcK family protein [Terriglobia bacterium]